MGRVPLISSVRSWAIPSLALCLPLATPAFARDEAACVRRLPASGFLAAQGAPGLRLVHGVVSGQVVVHNDRRGPGRMGHERGSRLIEIERIWGLGAKRILPELPPPGRLRALQLALYLKAGRVLGVRFWNLSLLDGLAGSLRRELLSGKGGRLLLDGAPSAPPQDGSLLVPSLPDGRWRTLTFVLDQPLPLGPEAALELYARTIFHNPLLPQNLATGTRIDACAYFAFE